VEARRVPYPSSQVAHHSATVVRAVVGSSQVPLSRMVCCCLSHRCASTCRSNVRWYCLPVSGCRYLARHVSPGGRLGQPPPGMALPPGQPVPIVFPHSEHSLNAADLSWSHVLRQRCRPIMHLKGFLTIPPCQSGTCPSKGRRAPPWDPTSSPTPRRCVECGSTAANCRNLRWLSVHDCCNRCQHPDPAMPTT
jgi:hypothetical protein